MALKIHNIIFYPLAGRLKENRFIHCNDEGIPYVKTQVKCKNSPLPGELNKLIPFQLDALTDVTEPTTFGDDYIESPQFEAASLIPTKDLSGNVPGFGITMENIITKRYKLLRAKYADNEGLENQKQPSSVESLSTIIWTRFVAVTKDESEPEELYTVNLRPRTDPPQPQSSFGNLFSIAITIPILKNGDQGHGSVHPV
ncbi:hypothetical protein CFP56_016169 [Quercus suber]|uniref:Uncharacterized protein n=1 Tax=Quercus suber TaxID=58331 RepID=A0AAW0KNV3_QUESU